MAKKYLDKDFNEVEATVVSAGAADAGKIPGLDAAGLLDLSVMPVGIAPVVLAIEAFHDIAAGRFVNIYDDGGTLKVRKADNTNDTKPADGFVLAAVTAGNPATVYFPGNINNQLSGLTLGAYYYLDTDGNITTVQPAVSGNIVQSIGKALSATALFFNYNGYRKLA